MGLSRPYNIVVTRVSRASERYALADETESPANTGTAADAQIIIKDILLFVTSLMECVLFCLCKCVFCKYFANTLLLIALFAYIVMLCLPLLRARLFPLASHLIQHYAILSVIQASCSLSDWWKHVPGLTRCFGCGCWRRVCVRLRVCWWQMRKN